jgi:UDPglucose 6-dehydrogenase
VAVHQTTLTVVAEKPSVLTIGFAGLTPANLVAAAAAARKGRRVVAFDGDIALTAALRRGDQPIHVPGQTALIDTGAAPIEYTATAADLSRCDIIYVDTSVDDKGQSNLAALKSLLADSVAAARTDAVIVLLSPVPPGFTRDNAPKGRSIFYQGGATSDQAVEGALRPEWIVVGCHDPAASLPASLSTHLASFGCPVLPMRYESAELARLAIDVVRAASDSATSTLAALCEKTGAEWAEIMPVLKLDRRIGHDGGEAPGIPDPALERSLLAALKLVTSHDIDASAIEAYLAASRRSRDWVLQCLDEHVLTKTPDARLGVFGGGEIAEAFLAALPKLKVRVFGPEILLDPARHGSAEIASDPLAACADADAVVILAPRPEFAVLDPVAVAQQMRGNTIIDPYQALDPDTVKRAGLAHHRLERSS